MSSFLRELSQRLRLNELIERYLAGIEELIVVPHLGLHQIPFAALVVDSPQPPLPRGEEENSLVLRGEEENSAVLSAEEDAFSSFSLIKGDNESLASFRAEEDAFSDFPLIKGDKREIEPTKTAFYRAPNIPGKSLTAPTPAKTTPLEPGTCYLGDLFRLRVISSCQILRFCHQRDRTEASLALGLVEDTRENLAFTPYECETLARTYGVPPERRLRGKAAKIEPYKALLQQVGFLHSSHHGKSNPSDPLASVLELADGNLTLAQLLTWRCRNLSDAFLSACETHLTTPQLTDDVLTLATGFLCAGASSVISTQWSVEDFASSLFSLFYYKSRFAGLSCAAALQVAQREFRRLTGARLQQEFLPQLQAYLQESFGEGSETYKNLQTWLEYRCREDFPFAEPFFWAGFVAQGM